MNSIGVISDPRAATAEEELPIDLQCRADSHWICKHRFSVNVGKIGPFEIGSEKSLVRGLAEFQFETIAGCKGFQSAHRPVKKLNARLCGRSSPSGFDGRFDFWNSRPRIRRPACPDLLRPIAPRAMNLDS